MKKAFSEKEEAKKSTEQNRLQAMMEGMVHEMHSHFSLPLSLYPSSCSSFD